MKSLRLLSFRLILLASLAGASGLNTLQAARSLVSGLVPNRPRIERSIAGDWHFKVDPENVGLQEEWFNLDLPGVIQLPGSLLAQGYGFPVTPRTEWTGSIQDRSYFTDPFFEPYRQPGNVKLPFWLTPLATYVGAAWYQRDVLIPPEWKRKRIVLTLERSHWETALWVDGEPVGSGDSLSTPHVYDVTRWMTPGSHRVTLRVDNSIRIPVGLNSHSITDHTQGNWNGIVGTMKLTASDPFYIEDIQVYPDLASRTARVVLALGNDTPRTLPANLYLRADSSNLPVRHGAPLFEGRTELAPGPSTVEITYAMGEDVLVWDEFNPALYTLEVTLESRSDLWSYMDTRQATFGMRHVGTAGTQITINGLPTFLRGTLECAIFPLTGYPPTDVESWRRIIRICKAHGLNHMRFHSWCPPEAAFIAADELGFYYQVESASWANGDTAIGDGKTVDRWITTEADRILKAYGNHPSFLLMAYGNEPAGKNQKQFLGNLVESWKTKDNRRLYTSAAGWPLIPQNDYHSSPDPRIQAWGAGLKSRINATSPATTADYRDFVKRHNKPVISHEIGQWCVYPNFREISKYSGAYEARNFEIFREHLQSQGMLDLADDFVRASGKLQALCYKEDIESALRTPGFGGFQLLDLHDFPGQGTALVGVLDAFWDSKGYISADDYRRFCSSTVPLARLTKRVWTSAETLVAELELAHFGPAPLEDATVYWNLIDTRGQSQASGEFEPRTYPIGNGVTIGSISVPLEAFNEPQQLQLVVGIGNASPYGKGRIGRTVSRTLRSLGLKEAQVENDWDLWVYPSETNVEPGANVRIATTLDEAAFSYLDQGGDVLLLPSPAAIAGEVEMGFSPIFWNTAWTQGQAPHTLGILCDPDHPALARFPTDYHSNWQWWYLVSSGAATPMDTLPDRLRPIVQVIDDWFQNRKLGLLFEARIGQGRLLFSSMDLQSKLAERPVARQMLDSLLSYMEGDEFKPSQELTPQHIQTLLK
jgi:hypothetical protein